MRGASMTESSCLLVVKSLPARFDETPGGRVILLPR
jgi:hypothetical protein